MVNSLLFEDFLELKGITKRFGTLVANNNITLDIRRGEIHALFGENGSGKTTLCNIIYGMTKPDEGKIILRGKQVSLNTPKDAIAEGIGMVHQHFMLVPAFSVLKNVILGLNEGNTIFIDEKRAIEKLEHILKHYGVEINPHIEVWKLSIYEQQWVEILKLLYLRSDLLIFDEPLTILSPQEADLFLRRILEMKASGITVILVSHRLSEVIRVADRISILRQGNLISTVKPQEISEGEIIEMMIGKKMSLTNVYKKDTCTYREELLRLENIQALSDKGYKGLKNISLTLWKGEILGIAGIAGNGQKELYEVITGIREITGGKIYFYGKDVTNRYEINLKRLNISEMPEDRINRGSIRRFSIQKNLLFGKQRNKEFLRGFFLDWDKIIPYTDRIINQFDIRTSSSKNLASSLSGGNLQKLILGRELSKSVPFIIAAHPTRGLDVVSTKFIRNKFLQKRKEGISSVVISEDLEELILISDRIAVIYNGKIVGTLRSKEANLEEIGLLMTKGKNFKEESNVNGV